MAMVRSPSPPPRRPWPPPPPLAPRGWPRLVRVSVRVRVRVRVKVRVRVRVRVRVGRTRAWRTAAVRHEATAEAAADGRRRHARRVGPRQHGATWWGLVRVRG
eukprot:scaffold42231_cov36-Phaeocystis_antarctica.AAC.1